MLSFFLQTKIPLQGCLPQIIRQFSSQLLTTRLQAVGGWPLTSTLGTTTPVCPVLGAPGCDMESQMFFFFRFRDWVWEQHTVKSRQRVEPLAHKPLTLHLQSWQPASGQCSLQSDYQYMSGCFCKMQRIQTFCQFSFACWDMEKYHPEV